MCKASANDVSVTVGACYGVGPQPRGLPTGESCGPRLGVPLQGGNGSPPAGREATEDPCHPAPLFALAARCQASGSKMQPNTHAHAHLQVGGHGRNYLIIEHHHIQDHILAQNGQKKTKCALIQSVLLALLPWNGAWAGEGEGGSTTEFNVSLQA